MARWEHLIESDETLRRLERDALSGASGGWERYIAQAHREGKTSRALQQLAANTEAEFGAVRNLLSAAERLDHHVLASVVFDTGQRESGPLYYRVSSATISGLYMSHLYGLISTSLGPPIVSQPHRYSWEVFHREVSVANIHFSVIPNSATQNWEGFI